MIRTLILVGLISICILIASCGVIPICGGGIVIPLEQQMRERLQEVKKEADTTIILTAEKMKSNELDLQIGTTIIDTLTKTLKQIDSLIAVSFQLKATGTKEEILAFGFRADKVQRSMQPNLKSLRDLYDISTYSQFETTTFFPVDSSNIPAEKIDDAKKVIEPIAQRIVRFLAEHPHQKFEVVIGCSSTPDNQEQTISLCKERARTVGHLLVDQILSQKEFIPTPERVRYNIKWVEGGKLATTDKRGGVVAVVWGVVARNGDKDMLHVAHSYGGCVYQ